MIINHNLNAMNAHRNMSMNNVAAGKSMEKLSSGLRINRAGDDAAGLAISEKMRGQIRGLDQAARNAQDGVSLIQTAEGALNETHSILQRMRELAVQGANDANDSDSRGAIQTEMNQLTSEINRIGNTTEFNTQKLLNGGTAIGAVGAVSATTHGVSGSETLGVYTMKITAADSAKFIFASSTYTATATDSVSSIAASLAAAVTASGVYTVNYTAGNDYFTVTQKVGSATATAPTASASGAGTVNVSATTAGVSGSASTQGVHSFSITTNVAKGDKITINNVSYVAGTDFTIGASAGDTASSLIAKINSGTEFTATATGAAITLTQVVGTATDPTVTLSSTGYNSTLQIGANQGQAFSLQISDMRAKALGIAGSAAQTANGITDVANATAGTAGAKFYASNSVTDGTTSTLAEAALDISSHDNATNAIKVLDLAINNVSSERSKLGAYQNRLEHTIANLGTSSENLTSAESRIRDVDMAKEMMAFSKNNILSQAAQAMLAQANQQPQGVLQLLR